MRKCKPFDGLNEADGIGGFETLVHNIRSPISYFFANLNARLYVVDWDLFGIFEDADYNPPNRANR